MYIKKFSKALINAFAGSATCINTDIGKTDERGRSCNMYRERLCGDYDDNDFYSHIMCCACGGGRYVSTGKIIVVI